jgi:hypothetical protein
MPLGRSKEYWSHPPEHPSSQSNTTTSLTQPFNKEIFITLKTHYNLCIFHSAFDAREETFIRVSKYWKKCITMDRIIII